MEPDKENKRSLPNFLEGIQFPDPAAAGSTSWLKSILSLLLFGK
jgi:hypothetical protein